ncbi:UTRA domain-containing protein [Limimaricola pyoseonensis]|uniref:Transcriptional regulator, GntR family n=1 Tax=Limimaricola pyoseonensis TaxID=521013 RepID=A0A1G7FV42_9RHOB|nr:UTRA domain-containing protein [Limimaricola pyoseonensis]SDE79783.1 transcriptional regulator, GntR family [Limimaricola pyoseonensis]
MTRPPERPPERTGFRAVKSEIRDRIESGRWGPGTLLPGEVELAEEFGCARATVNRALREIAEAGLVERRRRAGTRVRAAPLREARFRIPLVRAEIEATGARYRYALLDRAVTPASDRLRGRMELPEDARLLRLTCLHFADGLPYQLEQRWISLAALPQAETQDFADSGPNEWLVATVPYTEVEIAFEAAAAGPEAVAHLGFAPGAPVFAIERTTWLRGRAVTHARLSHRPGHRMTTRY